MESQERRWPQGDRDLRYARWIGIEVAKSTVEKYRIRSSKPPSPTWRAFLKNHVADLVSADFSTIPTINFKILFVLIVLSHHRRKVIRFNVTIEVDRIVAWVLECRIRRT